MHLSQLARAAKRMSIASWTIAGTASSIPAVAPQPAWLNDAFVYSAWAAIAIGTCSSLVWLGTFARPQPAGTTHKTATNADLPRIRRLAQRYFGPKVTSIERLRQWVERNPFVVEMVTRARPFGRHDLVTIDGYYCALPLNDSATRDLISGARGINEVMPEEICRPGDLPAAIYIGAIACSTDAGKAVALQGLVRLVQKLSHRQRSISVLARPVTADGMRLVNEFGLQPTQSNPMGGSPTGWVHAAKLSSILKHFKDRR